MHAVDLAPGVRKARGPTACIDHHVSPGSLPAGPRLVAPDASASAELAFDFATALGWELTPDALARHGATPDDLDGIVEFPRSIAGVRLALLFRQLANGRIKVSFRSL